MVPSSWWSPLRVFLSSVLVGHARTTVYTTAIGHALAQEVHRVQPRSAAWRPPVPRVFRERANRGPVVLQPCDIVVSR